MADLLRYNIYCNSEQATKEWILDEDTAPPTTCPTDTGHVVTLASVSVVEAIRTSRVEILDKDGKSAYAPTDQNGRPTFVGNMIKDGYLLYVTGAYDDVVGSKIGEGAQFCGRGTVNVPGRFLHHWYILGGLVTSKGAECEDWMSMKATCPATVATSTPGTGNADKVPLGGGANMFVPAAGDGDWTIDFDTMEAGEINQYAKPVPQAGGPWTWDPKQTPSVFPGTGYYLFDFVKPLARQANRIPQLFHGQITPQQLEGKLILPHWDIEFSFHEDTAGDTQGAACIVMVREQTI